MDSLFDDNNGVLTPHVFVAHNARDTSRAAAEKAKPLSASDRRRVLEVLVRFGGQTDEQLQRYLGMPANTQRPRRLECVQAGWVVDSGQRGTTQTGSKAIKWIATEQGKEALAASFKDEKQGAA